MNGGIAQLGEHMHHTHGVAGSSPVVSIISAVGRQRFLLQSLKKLNGWGHSLAGKALRSQRRDRGFESRCLHFILSLEMLGVLFNASIFKDFLHMYIYCKYIIKYTDYKKSITRNITRDFIKMFIDFSVYNCFLV